MAKIDENSEEYIEDDSEESFLRKNIVLIVWIFIFVSYIVISLYVLFNPNQLIREIWDDFQDYQKPLLTILPVVITATFLFLIFYLGKLHDYHREFIKQYGIYTEIKLLIERKYSSTEIKQHDELIKAMKNDDEYYDESNDFFKTNPKDLFFVLGGIILLLLFSYIFLLKGDMRSNDTLFIIITIIFGFVLIPVALFLSESNLFTHDQELKDITQDIAYLKAYLD